jgi:hypothetical protein
MSHSSGGDSAESVSQHCFSKLVTIDVMHTCSPQGMFSSLCDFPLATLRQLCSTARQLTRRRVLLSWFVLPGAVTAVSCVFVHYYVLYYKP